MVLPETVKVGSQAVLGRCHEVVDEMVRMSREFIDFKMTLKTRGRLERLRKAILKRKKTLENIERKRRLETARLKCFNPRLTKCIAGHEEELPHGWNLKRKKEWYHTDMRNKKQKYNFSYMDACCLWCRLGEVDGDSPSTDLCTKCSSEFDKLEAKENSQTL